jgi:hypothetical protein
MQKSICVLWFVLLVCGIYSTGASKILLTVFVSLVLTLFVSGPDAQSISNIVNFNGLRFATLDNVYAPTTDIGCQASPMALPLGWTLASSISVESTIVIMSYSWGTTCLVLSDGTALFSRLGTACGTSLLSTTTVDGVIRYQPTGCNRRILISQPGQGLLSFVGVFFGGSAC